VRIAGKGSFTFREIHRYDIWFDKKTYLPLKVVSYNLRGELIEELSLDDLKTDLDLPDKLFCL
jgi:outer membrane lipoprotein-sorting protein